MTQSRTTGRVVARDVVRAFGFAGAVSAVLVAPNAATLVDLYMKKIDKKNARRTLSYLKYKKLIEVREKNGEYYYRLTSRGRDRYQKITFEELSIQTPKHWDKKWRLVMFDIPAAENSKRRALTQKLRDMGFYMLQHSAWLHPFDCQKEVGVLLQTLNLERHVSLLIVEDGNFTAHATDYFKKANLLM
jgi:CRISPR-associated endonuclease Cas2